VIIPSHLSIAGALEIGGSFSRYFTLKVEGISVFKQKKHFYTLNVRKQFARCEDKIHSLETSPLLTS
jgi:hypothetical protein